MTIFPEKPPSKNQENETWRINVAYTGEVMRGHDSLPDRKHVEKELRTAEKRISDIKSLEKKIIKEIENGHGVNSSYFHALKGDYKEMKGYLRGNLANLYMMEDMFSRNKEGENINLLAIITTFLKQPLKKGADRFDRLPDRFINETPAQILEAEGWEYYMDEKELTDKQEKQLYKDGYDIEFARRSGDENSPAPVYRSKYKKDEDETTPIS